MKQRVFRINKGSPNGYITAKAPAMCYSNDGAIWCKINDEHNNSGWIPFLASQPTPAPQQP